MDAACAALKRACRHAGTHAHSLSGDAVNVEAVMCPCRYLIPGGSAGHYKRNGYTFDVGSSMMFGFGKEGTTNLITRALANVGKALNTVPDPCQIHYHLPRSEAHPDVGCSACCSLHALAVPIHTPAHGCTLSALLPCSGPLLF